jgi:hypothetical protein
VAEKVRKAVEAELARLASRAHGVVTRRQLLEAGISRHEIEHRIETRLLFPIHPGVYRVGHRAPSIEAVYMAAVLACGEGAVLSGRAAAHLFGLLKGGPPPPEVTAPTERRVKGVRTRRRRGLATTIWRAIPVTTVAQTVVDLAPCLPEDELALLFHEAGVRHHTKPAMVEDLLARHQNAPGTAKLRRIIWGDVEVLLSKLERGFRAHLIAGGHDLPETNIPVDGHYVDCRWPKQKLTVELDSYRWHNTRHSWDQDRQREREAYARGDDFRRYTWRDVYVDPKPMRRELEALLG